MGNIHAHFSVSMCPVLLASGYFTFMGNPNYLEHVNDVTCVISQTTQLPPTEAVVGGRRQNDFLLPVWTTFV